jgi:outer membrane lipoprotein carrier protein
MASLLIIALSLAACGQGEARADGDSLAASRTRAPVSAAAADSHPTPDRGDSGISDDDRADRDSRLSEASPANGEVLSRTVPAPGARQDAPAATPTSATRPAAASANDAAGRQEASETEARPADAGRQEEVLRATARAYEGLQSFRATFEQTLDNTLLGRTTRSEGTLFQRQPDRFLMRFSDPDGDVIVSDGDYFWMYFPSVDAKQVIRSRRGGQGLDLRSQFIGDPVRRFEATYHGTEAVRGRESHVMTLVPREQLGYQRLKVWIDARDHLVRRFELTENNGNIRRFVLSDLTINPSLPDDLFRFTPPAGAQVVER